MGSTGAEAESARTGQPKSRADLQQSLYDYMATLKTIDSHQHLWPESKRLALKADVLTLFSTYAFNDAVSAGWKVPAGGSPHGENYFLDSSIPLEKRWKEVWPFLETIRFGSTFRPTHIALRDIYGADHLGDDNYMEVSERIAAANKPGLYHNVLRTHCGITCSLVQSLVPTGIVHDLQPGDLLKSVYGCAACYYLPNKELFDELTRSYNVQITDLDIYLDVLTRFLDDLRKTGVLGIKIGITDWVQMTPDREAARKAFTETLKGVPADMNLKAVIREHVYEYAAKWDWPFAVHCGGIYMDFRTFDPRNILDLVINHPKVRFHLFHLGIPFVRETIFIAKQYANVHLNLTWCAVLSEELTRQAMHELLDSVPITKVTAFGGDYAADVENTYGHLVMVRELMADVLAERISRGHMNIEDAQDIASMWLHDNPVAFYGLGNMKS